MRRVVVFSIPGVARRRVGGGDATELTAELLELRLRGSGRTMLQRHSHTEDVSRDMEGRNLKLKRGREENVFGLLVGLMFITFSSRFTYSHPPALLWICCCCVWSFIIKLLLISPVWLWREENWCGTHGKIFFPDERREWPRREVWLWNYIFAHFFYIDFKFQPLSDLQPNFILPLFESKG